MSNVLSNKLSKIYYDPKNPASFASAQKLYNEIIKVKPTTKLSEVKNWLSGQLTYTLHKNSRKYFTRNKIIVSKIDQQWEADLVNMKEFSNANNNNTYILTVIDCFSKFAFVELLKQKTAQNVIKAFKNIFKKRKCIYLRTDKGTEFCNKLFQKFLMTNGVRHFTSNNDDIKCAIVERFNRTLKSKMFKYFTFKGTRKYTDILDSLLLSYNNSKHRIIKMAPSQVKKVHEKTVFKNIYDYNNLIELYKSQNQKRNKNLINQGDHVKRIYTRKALEKGYYPTWGDKIFTVTKTIKGNKKLLFKVKDEKGNLIPQRLYIEEIQKVNPTLFRVCKVLKTRTRKGKKEYFVKWLNHSDEYNSWVTNIQKL